MRVKIAVVGLVAAAMAVPVLSAPASATVRSASAPPAAPITAAAAKPVLKPGSKGAAVKQLQQRLKALHYDPGTIDGKYGQDTLYAVWAFKKVNGLSIKGSSAQGNGGVIGGKTWYALAHPKAPKKLKTSPANRVEISIKRQLVVVYKNNKVQLISHTSTGSGEYYRCSGGGTCKAVTPKGNFKVYRKIKGWRHAPLGYLYNPIYFYRGYAMHGSGSVPRYPASHGCARIPMHTADILPKIIPIGERVYVR